MNEKKANYIIPGEVRDAILRYLGERPHKEVEIGILALRSLKVLEDKEEKDE